MRIETRLTGLLGIDLPILQAPGADPATTIAISESGALGILLAIPDPNFAPAFAALRAATTRPFGIALPPGRPDATIAMLLAHPPPVLLAPAGDPALPAFRAAGTICLIQIDVLAPAAPTAPPAGDALLVPLSSLRAAAAAHPGIPLVAIADPDGPSLLAALALGAAAILCPLDAATPGRIAAGYRDAVRALPRLHERSPDPGRAAREAAALRDNLHRRKAQSRARDPGQH